MKLSVNPCGFGGLLLALGALACAHRERARPEADRRGNEERNDRENARLPLATTPAELLVPGAIEKIQDALAARGYLDPSAKRGHLDIPTAGSIRRFQSDQDIARTGIPDHETVRRLGLDPDALFRRAPSAGGAPREP
jgi:hypothetical protein